MKTVFTLFLFLLSSFSTLASEWRLAKNKCGVKINLRKFSGSSIKEIKMVGIIEVEPFEIIKVLVAPELLPKWHHGVLKARRVKQLGLNRFVIHMDLDFPWPLRGRESISELELSNIDNGFLLSLKQYPHEALNKSNVLISKTQGAWKVFPDKRGSRLEFQIHAEPGGGVPSFMINMFITKSPYETFLGLRKLLKTKECL